MLIDSKIVDSYLKGENLEGLKEQWIYSSIIEGKKMFELPKEGKREDINRMKEKVLDGLKEFNLMNREIFTKIFPDYKKLLKDLKVMLVLGCPSPYDAMVRQYNGEWYVIFDLEAFIAYEEYGHDIEKVIRQFITHEFTHICIMDEFEIPKEYTYKDEMEFWIFNEGLAHVIAFKENIENFDWSEYEEYYLSAKETLKLALEEREVQKQRVWIEKATAGAYWEKFGAIAGKIYFGKNIYKIEELYAKGYKGISDRV